MRTLMYATVMAIVSWMVFASLNELTSAHAAEGGCCASDSCGKSQTTGVVWWANLMVAIIATMVALYAAAKMTPYGRSIPTLF